MVGFGKGKKTDEVPEIDPELFSKLRRAVGDVLTSKLSSGKISDPEHGLYLLGVFVLFDWDSSTVSLYHITEDKLRVAYELEKAGTGALYRWSMVEHGTEFICATELSAIWQACGVDELDDEIQELAIEDFEGCSQFAVIQALQEVKKTRLMKSPESRDKLTLLAGGMNNEERPDNISLTICVGALNSESVANRFINDWMKLKGIKGTPAEWKGGLTTMINGRRVKAGKTTLARLVSKEKFG
jgi:hypothetical protein